MSFWCCRTGYWRCQCYTYLLLCFIVLKWLIFIKVTYRLNEQKNVLGFLLELHHCYFNSDFLVVQPLIPVLIHHWPPFNSQLKSPVDSPLSPLSIHLSCQFTAESPVDSHLTFPLLCSRCWLLRGRLYARRRSYRRPGSSWPRSTSTRTGSRRKQPRVTTRGPRSDHRATPRVPGVLVLTTSWRQVYQGSAFWPHHGAWNTRGPRSDHIMAPGVPSNCGPHCDYIISTTQCLEYHQTLVHIVIMKCI